MAIEDTFRGAKNAYIYYFAYLITVAREIGMERAIALQRVRIYAMTAFAR